MLVTQAFALADLEYEANFLKNKMTDNFMQNVIYFHETLYVTVNPLSVLNGLL